MEERPSAPELVASSTTSASEPSTSAAPKAEPAATVFTTPDTTNVQTTTQNAAVTEKEKGSKDDTSNEKSDSATTTPTKIVPPSRTVEQIQAECVGMISLLKQLEHEEQELHCQVELLSREALLCGFQPDKVEKVLLRRPSAVVKNRKVAGATTLAAKKDTPALDVPGASHKTEAAVGRVDNNTAAPLAAASTPVTTTTTPNKKVKTEDGA